MKKIVSGYRSVEFSFFDFQCGAQNFKFVQQLDCCKVCVVDSLYLFIYFIVIFNNLLSAIAYPSVVE